MITTLVMNKIIKTNKMKKEKLTIKQLAPYLAYDLDLECNRLFYPKGIEIIKLTPDILRLLHSQTYKIKPLLYPMEYLTKEITHKGEKFIPADRLFIEFGGGYKTKQGFINDFINEVRYTLSSDLSYGIVLWLVEHHFAVNIPEHLYINKATI